jgi:hypothetical protein
LFGGLGASLTGLPIVIFALLAGEGWRSDQGAAAWAQTVSVAVTLLFTAVLAGRQIRNAEDLASRDRLLAMKLADEAGLETVRAAADIALHAQRYAGNLVAWAADELDDDPEPEIAGLVGAISQIDPLTVRPATAAGQLIELAALLGAMVRRTRPLTASSSRNPSPQLMGELSALSDRITRLAQAIQASASGERIRIERKYDGLRLGREPGGTGWWRRKVDRAGN